MSTATTKGKKQRKMSNKIGIAVILFNDGPSAGIQNRKQQPPKDDVSLVSSYNMLNNKFENSGGTTSLSSISHNLLHNLQSSTDMKSQLRSLQSYRSTLLHPSFRLDHPHDSSTAEDLILQQGLFRLLLELAWSYGTPCSIKRASLTCVDALLKALTTTTTTTTTTDAAQQQQQQQQQRVYPEWAHATHVSLLTSILVNSSSSYENNYWMNPVTTLLDSLAYAPTKHILLHNATYLLQALLMLDNCMNISNNNTAPLSVTTMLQQYSFQTNNINDNTNDTNIVEASNAVERAVQITTTLRAILLSLLINNTSTLQITTTTHDDDETCKETLQCILKVLKRLEYSPLTTLTQCRATSSDFLSIAGVTLAQIKILQWNIITNSSSTSSTSATATTQQEMYDFVLSLLLNNNNQQQQQHLSALNHVAIIRGWIAVAPPSLLLYRPPPPPRNDTTNTNAADNTTTVTSISNPSLLFGPMFSYLLDRVLIHPSTSVRLSALRGWDSWISRMLSLLTTASEDFHNDDDDDDKLQLLLRPMLHQIMDMILVTWSSPPTRQIAAILPVVFSTLCTLLQHMDTNEKKNVCKNNHGSYYLKTITKRIVSQPLNRKGRYEALEILLPHVGAEELLSIEEKKELILSLMEGVGDTGNNSGAIAQLLGKVVLRLLQEQQQQAHTTIDTIPNNSCHTASTKQPCVKDSVTNNHKHKETTVLVLPPGFHDWLKLWINPLASALLSLNQRRRSQVAAFCLPLIVPMSLSNRLYASFAIESLILELTSSAQLSVANISMDPNECQNDNSNSGAHTNLAATSEVYFWAVLECAQYASSQKLILSFIHLRQCMVKCLPLDRFKSLLTYSNRSLRLAGFLAIKAIVPCYVDVESDNLTAIMDAEVALWKDALPYASKTNDKGYISKLMGCMSKLLHRLYAMNQVSETGSCLHKFVCNFLFDDIALQIGLYPGTVVEKEFFALSLIETIFTFASSLHAGFQKSPHSNCEPLMQSNKADRKITEILHHLVCNLSSVLSLVNSMWDATRATAFGIVRDLARWAIENNVMLPKTLSDERQRNSLFFRAIHLASSPRQREADTGAKILGLLYISASASTRADFFKDLMYLLIERLDMSEKALTTAMLDASQISVERDTSCGTSFPLAHGILHAVNIVVEQSKEKIFSFALEKDDTDALYQQLVFLCCRAIRISLTVVSDMENCADGNEDASEFDDTSPPLNANTGTLGANTSFSILHEVSEEENSRRKTTQRIVVGSWLLTKEACAALAMVFSAFHGAPEPNVVEASGDLLISTLTSLKHQGGAFAAHKALQRMAESCYLKFSQNQEIQAFPSIWINRLLIEISGAGNNSTLRRSTGYALGFLSILRTEPSPRCCMSPFVLASLIRISLPPKTAIDCASARLGIDFDFSYLQILQNKTLPSYVTNSKYDWRSRLHALNILRLLVLDSPLANDTKIFIGDIIIAGLLGYDGDDWDVRNSSTMVFSAAMLRVIDADKNAASVSKNDFNKKQGNAITARELFRNYPPLSTFLAAVLRTGLQSSNRSNSGPLTTIHPSLFPALLLLARLQPVEMTIEDEGDAEIQAPFLKLLFGCLQHCHHKVRCMAGRALACFCSGDKNPSHDSSRGVLLLQCMALLQSFSSTAHGVSECWNVCHGALVGIRELLITSSKPCRYFDIEAVNTISFYASWSNGSGKCPPTCSTVALEVLSQLNIPDLLDRAATIALEKTELVDSPQQPRNVIGMETLSFTAANFVVQRSRNIIFKSKTCEEERAFHMSRLKRAFLSTSFDVRCSSIKTFKKDLVATIHIFVSEGKHATNTYIVLKDIATLLYFVMRREMMRPKVESLGPHSASLRRLTKCLVDALTGCPSLEITSIFGKSSDCWNVLTDLATLGNLPTLDFQVDEHEIKAKRCNALAAAAVELMSFHIKGVLVREASFAGLARQFVDAVGVLIHPHNQFDVRFRSTRAIQTSQILRLTMNSSGDEPSLKEAMERIFLTLFQHTISLLQDNDEDIRTIASFAVSDALVSKGSRFGSSSVSLFTLERAFSRCYQKTSASLVVNTMMDQIIENCGNPKHNISLILDEFQYTENGESASLNLSIQRMIFEEEDPNPFQEKLVLIQLAASAWVCLRSQKGGSRLACIIYERCKSVLNTLAARIGSCFAYELTWCNLAFPSCQGLLLGGACLVYSGMDKSCFGGFSNVTSIVEDAEKLLLCIKSNIMTHSTIHPWVLTTLHILASAKHGESATKDGILKCCFLLPNIRSTSGDLAWS